MSLLELTNIPATNTGMLIRKSVGEVFAAIIDPQITTKFWFTKGSGKLETGKEVLWQWEMYDASAVVVAKVIETDQRIVIEWPSYKGQTTVEWTFIAQADDTTFVTVTESGFVGNGDELVQQVTDSTQGFSLMLAGMKAWLEHGIQLNLVADRYPAGLVTH